MLSIFKRITQLEGLVERIQEDTSKQKPAPIAPFDDSEIWSAMEQLSKRLDELTHAVAEGIERVDRSERRIKATVQRAKRRLEDAGFTDEGVEAEAAQLQLDHGDGSQGGGMHPVPEGMGNGQRVDLSAFPGAWGDTEVAALLRARG